MAVHYGCHLLKPSIIRPFKGESENPTFFDDIVRACGCESVEYREKFMCCGAGGSVRSSQKETSLKYTLEKLRQIRKVHADCIVVSCPFCQLQFDQGQTEIGNMLEEDEEPFQIPIIYISQLIGLAMGFSPSDLGMIKPANLEGVTPFIPFDSLLQKLGLME